jgi:hypothetical protein
MFGRMSIYRNASATTTALRDSGHTPINHHLIVIFKLSTSGHQIFRVVSEGIKVGEINLM